MQTLSKSSTKSEFDLILDFVRAVVPRNWNVYWSWSWKDNKKDPHTCNIQFQADPYRDILQDDSRTMVHYLRWSDGIMFTQIYLDTDDSDIEETILHELAHIAEHRYIMLKEGGYRHSSASICGSVYSHSNDDKSPAPVVMTANKYGDHGALFKRCLSAFRSRSRKKGAALDFCQLWS